MQRRKHECVRCLLGIVVLPAIAMFGAGCASRVFRADSLPPELAAPAPLDLEGINLSELSDQSVSVEVIQPGDVIDVSMVTDYSKLSTSTTPVRVADDGTIVIPLVGKVAVGGMEVERAEQIINSESVARGVFRNPCITVTMKQCRTNKVTVVGAVNEPGTHELPRGSSSLMAALVAAEGLSEEASTEVEIRHTDSRRAASARTPAPNVAGSPDGSASLASYEQLSPAAAEPSVTKIDLSAAASGAVKVPDLSDGDVVHVRKRVLQPIHVMGLVQKPGEFPYPVDQEIRVLDALALAGGISNMAAEDVLVIRKSPGAVEPVRIAVSIQAAKNGRDNLALAPGDIVTVEQSAATVAVDTIRTFFRFSMGSSVSWF